MKNLSRLELLGGVDDALLLDALPPSLAAGGPAVQRHRRAGGFDRFMSSGRVAAVLSTVVALGVLIAIVLAGQRDPYTTPPIATSGESVPDTGAPSPVPDSDTQTVSDTRPTTDPITAPAQDTVAISVPESSPESETDVSVRDSESYPLASRVERDARVLRVTDIQVNTRNANRPGVRLDMMDPATGEIHGAYSRDGQIWGIYSDLDASVVVCYIRRVHTGEPGNGAIQIGYDRLRIETDGTLAAEPTECVSRCFGGTCSDAYLEDFLASSIRAIGNMPLVYPTEDTEAWWFRAYGTLTNRTNGWTMQELWAEAGLDLFTYPAAPGEETVSTEMLTLHTASGSYALDPAFNTLYVHTPTDAEISSPSLTRNTKYTALIPVSIDSALQSVSCDLPGAILCDIAVFRYYNEPVLSGTTDITSLNSLAPGRYYVTLLWRLPEGSVGTGSPWREYTVLWEKSISENANPLPIVKDSLRFEYRLEGDMGSTLKILASVTNISDMACVFTPYQTDFVTLATPTAGAWRRHSMIRADRHTVPTDGGNGISLAPGETKLFRFEFDAPISRAETDDVYIAMECGADVWEYLCFDVPLKVGTLPADRSPTTPFSFYYELDEGDGSQPAEILHPGDFLTVTLGMTNVSSAVQCFVGSSTTLEPHAYLYCDTDEGRYTIPVSSFGYTEDLMYHPIAPGQSVYARNRIRIPTDAPAGEYHLLIYCDWNTAWQYSFGHVITITEA